MTGARFITKENLIREPNEWGTFEWLSKPGLCDAEQLLVIRVSIEPGSGHNFHRHPEMEEVIYILEGTCEQWVEQETRLLGPGDSVHIPRNTVHASFNAGKEVLRALAILSPAVIQGPLLVDVFQESPWNSLRKK